MIKYYVYNPISELNSEPFETREEAERELESYRYGDDAEIVEVDD